MFKPNFDFYLQHEWPFHAQVSVHAVHSLENAMYVCLESLCKIT